MLGSSHGSVRSVNLSRASESGEDVSVVQDPDTYFYNLQEKDHDSQWVRGLSPEDEEVTTNYKTDELSKFSRSTEGELFDSHLIVMEIFKYPLGLGAAFILYSLIQYATNMDRHLTIDFPATEEALWPQGWQVGESFSSFSYRILVPLIFSVILSCSFCAWLSFTVVRVTDDFTARCGVGTALLSVLGLLMQTIILMRACSKPVHDLGECEIPFVMYWVCSVARRWCPLMSLWCVTPALNRTSYRQWWKYLMAIPVLVFALAVLASIHGGNRASRLFVLAYELQILIWGFFIIYLWRQNCIRGKCGMTKSHAD
ncbi:unnamed protein product [Phytomonas sp. Hart1]|nr:unnamed protein product [Phytomonas sp. Hart1]|eukprot:CCW68770.1 unnamed protein product [Phytomonas sp. isolate Hart1]